MIEPSILNISRRIQDIGKTFHERMQTRSNRMGLHRSYYPILFLLSQNERLTQQQISDAVGYKPSTISITLMNMQKDGLVERAQSNKDKRMVYVSLTEAGHKLDQMIFSNLQEVSALMMRGFTQEEMDTLSEMLQRIQNNLREG